jgi:hypothetical protein
MYPDVTPAWSPEPTAGRGAGEESSCDSSIETHGIVVQVPALNIRQIPDRLISNSVWTLQESRHVGSQCKYEQCTRIKSHQLKVGRPTSGHVDMPSNDRLLQKIVHTR